MRALLIALGWAATVAAAFVLGKTMGEGATDPASEAALVRSIDEPARPDPVLAPGASRPSTAPTDVPPGAPTAPVSKLLEAGETLEPFTLEGVTDPDVAMGRLMRHLAALLAKGKAGHLELLAFLDEHVANSDELERFFHREEDAVRFIVPWVEFLVERKGPVVGVIETVFETMAERPEALAEIDNDTLEIFTEGAAVVLPGAVDERQLAKFRGYARAVLETPEGSLPESVERQRRRLRQALTLWTPRLGAEDALARLKSGEISGAEAIPILRGLTPEQLRGLDLGEIVAPAVAAGDYRALRGLRELPLEARDVALLDGTLLEAAARAKVSDWAIVAYLGATDRATWPAGQAFVESLLARGGTATKAAALALGRIGKVPKDYARWVLDTYDLPEDAVKHLKRRFGLE